MSTIIETYNRGRFHVDDNPQHVRQTLREHAAIPLAAAFRTTNGQLIFLRYGEVKRIRYPRTVPGWLRKLGAIVGIALLVVPCYLAGTAMISLGGYAFVSELFGHGADVTPPGWLLLPGLVTWYAGGAIGTIAMDVLER